jgi:hypothetical protein
MILEHQDYLDYKEKMTPKELIEMHDAFVNECLHDIKAQREMVGWQRDAILHNHANKIEVDKKINEHTIALYCMQEIFEKIYIRERIKNVH